MEQAPAHSEIGASSMKRFKNCPGSVKLSRGIPEISSRFADEGTEAHEWAKKILDAWKAKLPEPDLSDCDNEMLDAVMVYVEHMKSLWRKGCIQLFEHRFDLSKIYPGCFGTADGVTYYPEDRYLIISDYKHGAGVFVDVFQNEQLLYYALGAATTLGIAVDKVRLEIIQPRIFVAEKIRAYETDAVELGEFSITLSTAARRTRDANAPLAMGDWCRWCPAGQANVCPLIKESSKKMALEMFDIKVAAVVDYEKLSEYLDKADILEDVISSMREFAYAQAMAGIKIPNRKLVAKRPKRDWKEGMDIVGAFKHVGLTEKHLTRTVTKMLSPAQIEAIPATELPVGKKDLKEFITKLVDKKSSGYALVADSDPRAEIKQIDFESAFGSADAIDPLS